MKVWETVFSIFVAKSISKPIFFSLSFTQSMETNINYNDINDINIILKVIIRK